MPSTQHRLQVTPDRRFLQYADGAPFFYLGDTAREPFYRLTPAETDRLSVQSRPQRLYGDASRGLGRIEWTHTPNGDLALHDVDPTRPNEVYFRHVDVIVALSMIA